MTSKIKDEPEAQMHRLEDKIIQLGGTIPQPWPWAINKTMKRKGKIVVEVDLGLRNLQLLELVEDLQKAAKEIPPPLPPEVVNHIDVD